MDRRRWWVVVAAREEERGPPFCKRPAGWSVGVSWRCRCLDVMKEMDGSIRRERTCWFRVKKNWW
jgi:hypothetical protein